jgi:hypothetical protein
LQFAVDRVPKKRSAVCSSRLELEALLQIEAAAVPAH